MRLDPAPKPTVQGSRSRPAAWLARQLYFKRELDMNTDDKPKGPASYFPSIEKKYGQPIGYWLDLVGAVHDMKHMEIVAWLKREHGLGHGHANAIVAHVLANKGKSSSGQAPRTI